MRAFGATLRAAMAEAWANRSGFWTQLLAMFANDLAWVAFWLVFFDKVGAVRGWDTDQVLMLLAILTSSAGLVLGVFSNARRIGRMAAEGDLDAALALPVPPLAHLLVRRIDTTNLGDLVFGLCLFAIAGDPSPSRLAIYLFGVATAATLFAGFLITIGSLAFFAGRNDAGDLGFHAVLMFAAYPVDVFAGAAKVFLYVVVPAAFMGAVPARLLDSFDGVAALALLGAALSFAVLGWFLFRAGLQRYTSGAVWTQA
jgi:ABC-2 type transport system permease protein